MHAISPCCRLCLLCTLTFFRACVRGCCFCVRFVSRLLQYRSSKQTCTWRVFSKSNFSLFTTTEGALLFGGSCWGGGC